MTHTDDHGGVHLERILLHEDVEAERLGNDGRLGFVTQAGEGQVHTRIGNVDHVVSVSVGYGTRFRFVDDNGDARYRLTVGIDDFSFDDLSFGTGRCRTVRIRLRCFVSGCCERRRR